jgi:hypothetical protein
MRRVAVWVGGTVAVAVFATAWLPTGAPPRPLAVEPEIQATPGVRLGLHPDEPLSPGETTVWTAAIQVAWDGLRALVAGDQPLRLGPPAPASVVAALNRGSLPPGVVDPADLLTIGGAATPEAWRAIHAAASPGFDRGRPPSGPGDVVLFARLTSSVRYETPFDVLDEPIAWGTKGTRVVAYGLRAETRGPVAEGQRKQVRIHLPAGAPREHAGDSAVVVLHGEGGRRVVLSARPPQRTLRATWDDVAAVLADVSGEEPAPEDHLAVPRVALHARRDHLELVGAPVLGWRPGAAITMARQEVTLAANERGAELDAQAMLVATGGITEPLVVVLDRPFLLALLAPGTDVPHAIAWIGGVEALEDADARPPLRAGDLALLVGAWQVDVRASVEATAPSWEQAGGKRRHLETALERARFGLEVTPLGAATVQAGAGTPDAATTPAELFRDGAWIALVVRGEGKESGPRYLLRAERGRLTLVEHRSGVTWILVPR